MGALDSRLRGNDGGSGMRLLLVEDDVMVASGIKLGLTDAGYTVDWVGSAERAEEVLRTEVFDAAGMIVVALSWEEIGLLRILEKIRDGDESFGPAVRLALTQRGLIDESDPKCLTAKGCQVLEELRSRESPTRDRLDQTPN